MRKIFLAMLMLGTAAAPAIAATAARPTHHRSSVQHQSSQRSRPSVSHSTTRHVTHAPSSQHLRSNAPRSTDQHRPPPVSSTPHFGTQPPPPHHEGHRSSQPHWDNNWRHDHRYDWHDYRQHHRSAYHLGYYNDPFGWAYQMFGIGWRLWPNYYSSAYWINDPGMYRLPPAPPGTRWIRYYNDALLVDTWTGEVIDVIHNIFW